MLAQFQAIIFDFDDTLVKTIDLKWNQHKENARKNFGVEITDEKLRKHWGEGFKTLVKNLYGDVDSVENIIEKYYALRHNYYKPSHLGALELVRHLISDGKEVGILTSMDTSSVVEDFERLKYPYKDFVILQGEDQTEYHKPDPRVFEPTLEALAKKGITNLETVYIGDAIRDYVAARDAGISFVGVTTGLTSGAEFAAEGALYVDSLEKLVE